jgi:hypothetical protein
MAFFISHSQADYRFNLTNFNPGILSIFIILSQTALVL